VAGLRHLPEDDVDVASAAAEDRQRLALALRHALRLCAVVAEAEIEDFRAGRRAAHRGVGVQADEQVRLVVIGHGGALVEADGLIGVAREDDARAQAGLDGRLQPPRDAERHVLFERALRSACTVFIASMAGVDHDGAHAPAGAMSSSGGVSGAAGAAGCWAAGGASVVCATISTTMRPRAALAGCIR
jgi:hypothetical protein